MKGKLKHAHFLVKALLLVVFMLVFSLISIGLWALCTQGNATSVTSLKVLQLLQAIGVMILPCLICLFLWYEQPFGVLGFNRKIPWQPVLAVVVIMVVAVPFINLLSYLNQQMELPAFLSGVESWMKASEDAANQLTEQFLAVSTLGGLLFNILLMAMLPAFSEELLFRGVLQQLFSEKGHVQTAIWVCAILFSAVHLQFYGFIPRMLLGAFFGYLFVWSGSLWLPMLAHFVNNALATICYYVATNYGGGNTEFLDEIGTGEMWWLGALSGVLCCAGIYWLRRSLTMSSASSRKSEGN